MFLKVTGIDGLKEQLDEIVEAVADLKGNHEFDFNELFDIQFMRTFTNHEDFISYLVGGGFKVETQEDFDELPEDQLDAYIQKTTKFDSWQSMLGEATEHYVVKKLGF